MSPEDQDIGARPTGHSRGEQDLKVISANQIIHTRTRTQKHTRTHAHIHTRIDILV